MLASTHGPHVPSTRERIPSSRALEDLLRQAPADYFTLGWLLSTLSQRSFGVVFLFLGLLATVPIGSSVPGFMLAIIAVQMIIGRRELQYLEKAVYPRWTTAFEAGKPFVGVVVLLLTGVLLLTPVPFSNVVPAILVVLISLAYIQKDGLLLCVSFLAALILISIASAAVWGTIFGASLISDIW